MLHSPPPRSHPAGFGRALLPTATLAIGVLVALVASTLVSVQFGAPPAQAMGSESLEVWGVSGGIVDNPKQWKFRQSRTRADNIGSATAAAIDFDDSLWETTTVRWEEITGHNVGNHFRKDFRLDDIGVELYQVAGIQVALEYDDTAVMYLNGVEVYRSIRGNLDPEYIRYPLGTDIPYSPYIPYGGYEDDFIDIPNINGTNECEHAAGCPTSPYDGPNPPAIPTSLLREGVNTWAVTTWNQSGLGTDDATMNHTFELLINEDAVAPNTVVINEVMASNDSVYGVDLDNDGDLEYPDWFELYNTADSPVNLAGWTVSDSSASWLFPSIQVPAKGYLVVVASDNDRRDTRPVQTNFKLSSAGDTLKLTTPEGFIADDYGMLSNQFSDNSYGRDRDTGAVVYLSSPTPGARNSAAGNEYTPVLRPFADRMYNAGETVDLQAEAFDPDGDALSYRLSQPPPGVSIGADGSITGTANVPGTFTSLLTVTDADNDAVSQQVKWTVLPAITAPLPIVLNEYNAVPGDRELLGGSAVGNGGDWYEFVVVEDQLDLRGYSFELYDNKGPDDQLRLASTVTFGDSVRLGRAPAGTIITISEEFPDDLSFNAQGDWHINFQVTKQGGGSYFEDSDPDAVFNSTRSGQRVLIKNASGDIVAPLSGETDAWDSANGGVSGGEVMNLCIDPKPGTTVDPIADYRDNGTVSTFGEQNRCVYANANDPSTVITRFQRLSTLQATATFGANGGDTNCDLKLDIGDALRTAQYSVGTRADSGPCFFTGGGPGFDIYVDGADINDDGSVTIGDALIIAQCSVGITRQWCPE